MKSTGKPHSSPTSAQRFLAQQVTSSAAKKANVFKKILTATEFRQIIISAEFTTTTRV
ncbi:unnamed protein product [Oikopleura dioica]|uniref:Uncharacterized protein n=1 Tax=Oikopleura dioica TaxID=34765 RepID=E4XJI4_OIKDI|nr:unnamed protein product [Oikopleura dioica]